MPAPIVGVVVGTVKKTSTEKIPFAINFKDVLPSGETILAGSSITAYDPSGTDVSSSIIHLSTISGTKVVAILKAGTPGTKYSLKTIGLTTNYQFEAYASLDIIA